jgi:hypothetical protein
MVLVELRTLCMLGSYSITWDTQTELSNVHDKDAEILLLTTVWEHVQEKDFLLFHSVRRSNLVSKVYTVVFTHVVY